MPLQNPVLQGRIDPQAERYLREMTDAINALQIDNQTLVDSTPDKTQLDMLYGPVAIRRQLQSNGKYPLNLTQLPGVVGQAQFAKVTTISALPTAGATGDVADGTLTVFNGTLYRFQANPAPGQYVPVQSNSLYGTHAQRLAKYPAATSPDGQLFFETDRTVTYQLEIAAGIHNWIYTTGVCYVAQAGIAAITASLGANDTGFLLFVSDYGHQLRWSGTVWQWAPGDNGSGYQQLFDIDPTGVGWHLCDGATVSYLKQDGTIGSYTLANEIATPVYLKTGAANSGPNAAVAPTFTGSASANTGASSAGTPAGNVGSITATATGAVNVTVSGATQVAAQGHTHPAPSFTGTPLGNHDHTIPTQAGTISNTGEPANLVRRPWFRQ